MSYDNWKTRAPDDDPEGEHQPDLDHYPEGECDCHCPTCGGALSLDPFIGKFYARCGDCEGGRDDDGEAFRGGEAAAYEREQMVAAQRLRR